MAVFAAAVRGHVTVRTRRSGVRQSGRNSRRWKHHSVRDGGRQASPIVLDVVDGRYDFDSMLVLEAHPQHGVRRFVQIRSWSPALVALVTAKTAGSVFKLYMA